ncbi:MAG TPA: SDR family oxidoreductase [Parafilimonas sp.]|nr:SDR family oxidoreductase [Parafilimonas sp.]
MIILITGSSTGIGYAAAETLARNGHTVYATMRNPHQSTALQQLAKEEKLDLHILQLDVLHDDSVHKAVDTILSKEGHIDVLVNNAGIASWGAVEELSFEFFKADMNTNYFGTVRCIKAVLPSMRERKAGYIINMSSVSGKVYGNFHSSYNASKAAMEAFSESLAQELVPFNVHVVVIQPAFIETPIFHKINEIPSNTRYPNIKRFLSMFAASLENHESANKVADLINDIVSGKRNAFRTPVGLYADGFLNFRASISDEDWINSVALTDDEWINSMEQMGLGVGKYMKAEGLPQFSFA